MLIFLQNIKLCSFVNTTRFSYMWHLNSGTSPLRVYNFLPAINDTGKVALLIQFHSMILWAIIKIITQYKEMNRMQNKEAKGRL